MKARATQRPAAFTAKNAFIAVREAKDAFFNGTPAQLAAGVAYFGILSFFALIGANVAINSMVMTPQQLADTGAAQTTNFPRDIASLFSAQLQNAAAHQHANLAVAVFAIGLSIFGVSGAVEGLLKAITTIYGIRDTRPFIVQKLMVMGLTIAFIVGLIIILPLVFIGSNLLTYGGAPHAIMWLYDTLRWPLLLFLAMVGLGVLYHYALPQRIVWRWVSWGSVIATALWLTITLLFFVYLQHFANFSNSYSLFAGIIALMMWINFSALAVLIGAQVNKKFDQIKK